MYRQIVRSGEHGVLIEEAPLEYNMPSSTIQLQLDASYQPLLLLMLLLQLCGRSIKRENIPSGNEQSHAQIVHTLTHTHRDCVIILSCSLFCVFFSRLLIGTSQMPFTKWTHSDKLQIIFRASDWVDAGACELLSHKECQFGGFFCFAFGL